jgi:hypothetical protein
MSAIGAKADITIALRDAPNEPKLTSIGIGHFSSHDPVTDKQSHGTGVDPES